MKTYKIVRYYSDDRPSKVIKYGLSLDAVKLHCGRGDTQGVGKTGVKWFDGYTESKRRGRPGGLGR